MEGGTVQSYVEVKKSLLSGYLSGFRVCAHTFICLYETSKRLRVIRDTIFQQLVFSGRGGMEGRNSHVSQDHIGTCHMQTNMNKKASEHMNYPCELSGMSGLSGILLRY